eukprot:7952455-Ditylum_brightwellii.AAC.1
MDQECKVIEREAIQVFTLRTGYNRNMAKVIRNGPAELAGAAMTCLIDVQGREQAQHQCGWHESILIDVNTVFPHFEACWLNLL